MSLDNILDSTLEDLADLPSIKLFADGAHKVRLNFKLDLTKQAVQLKLTYLELGELANPTDTAPAAGDTNTMFFNLKSKDGSANEFAQGRLKEIVTVLQQTFGGTTTKDVCEKAENAEVMVSTKIQPGKAKDDGSKYPDQLLINSVIVL